MEAAADPGALSTMAARALALCILFYAGTTTYWAIQALRGRLPDRWSAVTAAVVMAALAALLWTHGPILLPATLTLIVLALVAAAVVATITLTMARYEERVEAFRAQTGARLNALLADVLPEERHEEWLRLRQRWRLGREERRKFPHLLTGLVLLAYLGVGHLLAQALHRALPPSTGDLAHSLAAAAQGPTMAAGQAVAATVLLILLVMILPNELLRLRYPELSYPFKSLIQRSLRPREAGLFGAHYYIVAALPLAVLWVGRDPSQWPVTVPAAMAVIAITVYADAASALVGIRWGRRKWIHNRDKSLIGTFGGCLVAFVIALPLTGPVGAVACTLAFLLVDVTAPVPVAVSDNLLNPIALAAALTLVQGHLDPWIPYF